MQRRNAIKLIGSTAITTGIGSTAGLAKSSRRTKLDGVLVNRISSPNNPIGEKEAKQLAKRAERRYFAEFKDRMETDAVFRKRPIETKSLNTVGYAIYVAPSGRTSTFIGQVPDHHTFKDVSAGDGIKYVRNKMDSWAESIKKREERTDDGDDFTTMASWENFEIDQDFSSPVAEDKVVVGDGDDYCPHGHLNEHTALYEHPQDGSVFAAATESDIITGYADCANDNWRKSKYRFKQQWQSGSYDVGTMTDRVPNGHDGSSETTVSGSIGYSAGGVTATVGVTFDSSNMEITDESGEDEGNWWYNFNSPGKKSSATVNNTSYFDFDSTAGYGDQLVETYNKIIFSKVHETYKKSFESRTAYDY